LKGAFHFAKELAGQGWVIVSGLARGIDTAAHQGALAACGKTVAFLAHGLDTIYPPENRKLAHQIIESGGCVASEYPPGTPIQKMQFPQRNRLISGISRGVIVVEASLKSGSLHTAQSALDQGKELFVLAGSWEDQGLEGNHRLIQIGAKLVYKLDDVLEEFPGEVQKKPEEKKTLESYTMSELLLASGLEFSELLLFLEKAQKEGRVFETQPQVFLFEESEKNLTPWLAKLKTFYKNGR
jgi:DNA processing protein